MPLLWTEIVVGSMKNGNYGWMVDEISCQYFPIFVLMLIDEILTKVLVKKLTHPGHLTRVSHFCQLMIRVIMR